jgi:hypothetical protein
VTRAWRAVALARSLLQGAPLLTAESEPVSPGMAAGSPVPRPTGYRASPVPISNLPVHLDFLCGIPNLHVSDATPPGFRPPIDLIVVTLHKIYRNYSYL